MTASAAVQIASYLASINPVLRAHLERLDDAGVERLVATALLINGSRLRELVGDTAADAVLQIAAETLWKPTTHESPRHQ